MWHRSQSACTLALVAGLLCLGGAASFEIDEAPYERLNASGTTYALAPVVTFKKYDGKFCEGKNLNPEDHWHKEVRDNSCSKKCSNGKCKGANCFCEGYLAAYDKEGSDAMCLSGDKCKALCIKLEDCYAVEIASNSNEPRCFLQTSACNYEVWSGKFGANDDWNFWLKELNVTASCPMGVGAEVSNTEGVTDTLYQKQSDKRYIAYTAVDIEPHARVVWHHTGCGWAIEKDLVGYPPTPAPQPKCEDDIAAANAMFGHGADAQDSVCTNAKAWSGGGYCEHAVFKRLCAKTCGDVEPCTSDSNVAAVQYAVVKGDLPEDAKAADNPDACNALSLPCGDPVVKRLCFATCSSARRLARFSTEQAATMAGRFRQELSQMTDVHRLRARRLGVECYNTSTGANDCPSRTEERFVESYYTWRPTNDSGGCVTAYSSPNTTLMDVAPLWDVLRFNRPVPLSLTHSCPVVGGYESVSGKFCPHNNLNGSEVANDRCWNKCVGGADKAGAVGVAGFCHGNDGTFNVQSNALCLPRGRCERLCSSLGDACSSIDMHDWLPRCYLNGPHCTAAVNYRTNLTTNSSEFSILYKEEGRTAYRSLDDMQCNGSSALINEWTNGTRSQCEQACTVSATCAFAEIRNQTCALHNSSCVKIPGINITLIYTEVAAPCFVTVAGHEESERNGEYVKSAVASGGEEFRMTDNSTRLKWKALGDSTCDGWVFQTNGVAKTKVTIRNCTDDNAAAGEYLKSLSSRPCAAAKTKGNCTNLIVKGLCPVTCKDYVSSSIAGDEYTYQLTQMGYNSSCLGDNNAAAWQYSNDLNLNQSAVPAAFFCERNTNMTLCTRFLTYNKLCSATCTRMLSPNRRMLEIEYQDAHNGDWSSTLRTWANGSSVESHYSRQNCSVSGTQAGAADYSFLTTDKLWYVLVPKADDSAMKWVCRSEAVCPIYTTCHLSHMRFRDEMRSFRGTIPRSQRIRDLDTAHDRYVAMYGARWVPKVLVSAARAEAIVTPPHWEFGKEIFRSVPGHTRVRVRKYAPETTRIVVSLSSADDPWAQYNFNRTYEHPKGYKDWMSDVIRFEVFQNVSAVNTTFEFDVYVAALSGAFAPKVYRFSDKMDAAPVAETDVTKSDTNDNWYTVRTSVPNADFVVTVDVDECSDDNNCETTKDGGICINQDGGYTCACQSEYDGDGFRDGSQCKLKEVQHFHNSYSEYGKQSLLIYHQTKMHNGWRLKQVKLYYDEECTDLGPTLEDIEVSGTYPTSSKEFIRDTTGPNVEWWCDTLSADRDDGTGCWVKITYSIVNTPDGCPQDVKCVKVEQADCDGHFAPEMSIRRGRSDSLPSRDGWNGQPGGFSVRGHPGWTMLWDFTKKEMSDTYDVTCGKKNTQIFGELLTPDGYTGVASACVCKQLCLDHIDEGCRSWKFYEETLHCFLQRNVFKGNDKATSTKNRRGVKVISGEGWWKDPSDNWPGWTSGYTDPVPLSFSTDPAKPQPDKPFELTIEGAGFPWDPEPWEDVSGRQRIKIVGEDDFCSTALVPEQVGGVACSTGVLCGPKPHSASRDKLVWKDITIGMSKEHSEYKICYCSGQCSKKSSWIEMPGRLDVRAASYSWKLMTEGSEATATETPAVTTKDIVKLTVSRPSFSSIVPSTAWRVKLVRDLFSCKHRGDATICAGGSDCGAPATDTPPFGPDEAQWNAVVITAKTPAGAYMVCLSEDSGATYHAIPSKESFLLTIETHPDHSTEPRGVYHDFQYSVAAGVARWVKVAGYKLWVPAQDRIAVTDDPLGCKAATFAHTFSADSARSTADDMAFNVLVPSTFKGKHTVCYCDSQTATGVTASGKNYYKVAQDKACGNAEHMATPSTLDADVCFTKCSAGCLGANCFCDGYDNKLDTNSSSKALCMSPSKCQAACSAESGCTGYVMHNNKNRCYLVTNATACLTDDVAYDTWARQVDKTVCFADADFKATTDAEYFERTLGSLYVTQRANVGVDYVVPPKEDTSLEITGRNLSYFEDRILVVDCKGVCGVSEPTEYAKLDEGIRDWYSFDATNAFFDKPHNDTEGPYRPTNTLPRTYSYVTKPQSYCPGNNIEVENHPNRLVANHQCYKKCQTEAPCNDPYCFCDGFIQGRDTSDSEALCLSEAQCKHLCNSVDDCFGIDMHVSKPRCFLNLAEGGTCGDMVNLVGGSSLAPDDDYKFLVRTEDNDLSGSARRMAAVAHARMTEGMTSPDGRHLLSALDPGTSWSSLLRFKPLSFVSGGTFKLCFCDSELLRTTSSASNRICKEPQDFTIEIGTVHSSGIHCLLTNTKLQKGKCVNQYYGGLRCYDNEALVPETPFPDEFLGVPDPAQPRSDSELLAQLSAWCVFGPPEETSNNPMCTLRA